MKRLTLLIGLIALVFIKVSAQSEPFTKRTVVTIGMGLNKPWECVYGPNDSLFVSESGGYLIRRISTNTTPGVATTILDISNQNDEWSTGTGPQGFLGLALHPALYSLTMQPEMQSPGSISHSLITKRVLPTVVIQDLQEVALL